jgi:spore maturation protein SpmB
MAVLKAIWLPFLSWAVAVLVVSFGGKQPGVVCATPMAWFMALWVGLRSAAYTRSETKGARLMEAALAGGIFGLLQGVLFTAIVPFMGEIKTNEQRKAVVLAIVMTVLGALISVLLAECLQFRQRIVERDRIGGAFRSQWGCVRSENANPLFQCQTHRFGSAKRGEFRRRALHNKQHGRDLTAQI